MYVAVKELRAPPTEALSREKTPQERFPSTEFDWQVIDDED